MRTRHTSNLILCVDDEAVILESLKTQLREHYGTQFAIETCESGEEALETLHFLTKRGIGRLIVITDWLMPGMKGDELLLKISLQYPAAITFMLSGEVDPKARQASFQQAKMYDFFNKPWQKEELFQSIDKALVQ
ncbi:MAG: response regulator [Bernardetiaceae bacterium]